MGKELSLGEIRIDGARLTAPGWSGVFARYEGRPGLLILSTPAEVISAPEFGEKQDADQE